MPVLAKTTNSVLESIFSDETKGSELLEDLVPPELPAMRNLGTLAPDIKLSICWGREHHYLRTTCVTNVALLTAYAFDLLGEPHHLYTQQLYTHPYEPVPASLH